MRLISITTMIAFCFISEAFAQNKGYTILGNIENLPDGITFYLIQNKENGQPDTVDRVKSRDQKFLFNGILKEEGIFQFVKMDTAIIKPSKTDIKGKIMNTWVRLLLDNSGEIIKLTGNIKDWPSIKVEGADLNQSLEQFLTTRKVIREEIYQKFGLDDGKKNDTNKVEEARKEYGERYLKDLSVISDSYVLPVALFNNRTLEIEQKEAAYQKFSDKLKNSYYGKKLNQQIVNIKASKNIGVGKVIPDFKIKTKDGKLEAVRKLAMKSKYTLLDFWASWCKPCRMDIPNLKKVYKTFNAEGFNIISVSIDYSIQGWKKALIEENTPWINGIQEGNTSKEIFGLISIPAYILLNEKAEIVQLDLNSSYFSGNGTNKNGPQVFLKDSKKKDLRGDDLYKTIEELLKKGK